MYTSYWHIIKVDNISKKKALNCAFHEHKLPITSIKVTLFNNLKRYSWTAVKYITYLSNNTAQVFVMLQFAAFILSLFPSGCPFSFSLLFTHSTPYRTIGWQSTSPCVLQLFPKVNTRYWLLLNLLVTLSANSLWGFVCLWKSYSIASTPVRILLFFSWVSCYFLLYS